METYIREGDWPTPKANKLKTPMYMLPKIHKPNNPGRPVVSSVNSHTEEQSLYVDVFLRPLAEKLPSHIRDTIDRFYQNIKKNWTILYLVMRISYKLRVPQWALELLPTSQIYTWAD